MKPNPDNPVPGRMQGAVRLAEVLGALSLATDLGTGKPMGHAMRACTLGMHLAQEIGLPEAEQAELYYSFLLMHSGCTVFSREMSPTLQGDELAAIADITLLDEADPRAMLAWMRRNVAPDAALPQRLARMLAMLLHSREVDETARGACEVAQRVAQRLGMPEGVQQAVRFYLERWDGKGPSGLAGEQIPLSARLLHLSLKIEATLTARGRNAAETALSEHQGKTFDPDLAATLLTSPHRVEVWEILEKKDVWEAVLALEPDSPYRYIPEEKLDEVALAVADFVDLKSPETMGHSRATARLAEGIARRLNLPAFQVTDIRRAALVHDLGLVALPGRLLSARGELSAADQEKLRLHPYYTERVLARAPALGRVAAIAGMQHERLDGTGYYRGLSGKEIPLSACILALADAFEERCHPTPDGTQPDPGAVLTAMQPEVGSRFSAECCQALAEELGAAQPRARRKRQWPAGLTTREVEVLQELAAGSSNKEIAAALVISEKTVAHHLEHIYNKIGVSSRAAAVFFAMEHELI